MRRLIALLSAVVSIQIAGLAAAENWPQWRGPNGDGTTSDTAPTEWSAEKNVQWRVELPEAGNSTPIVWGDRVFASQAVSEGSLRTLMCFARGSGSLLWQKGVTYTEEESSHRTNPYCSATPATDGERVIVWHGSAGLHCYSMDGEEIWSRDLGKQEHMWGYGSSPILYGDLCILNFGPGTREFLLAVDKRTGETVWEVSPLSLEEETALSGPENDGNVDPTRYTDETTLATMLRGSWSTPVIVEAERDELVVTQSRRVSAYDPQTGELLWVCGGLAPLAYSSPVAGEGLIVAMGGYHGGSLAVRPGGSGDVTDTHRIWHRPRGENWLSTGILHDGYIYLAAIDLGILRCYDARTGEEQWTERLRSSGRSGAVWGSLTQSGDGLIYLLNQSGDTFVFRPSPEKYDEVARNSLGEAANATPVISDGQVFLRTHEALWCIE